MRSDKKLWEICREIYRQMYKEAEPSLDFDKAIEEGITAKDNWFMNYYLSQKRQKEIYDEVCEKYKVKEDERSKISVEIWLGSSPNCSKKNDK